MNASVTPADLRPADGVPATGTYLDNASTAHPKPDVVWRAMRDYLTSVGASPGRGGYARARHAHRVVEDARAVVARLLGVADPGRIAFAPNATAALNTGIQGSLSPGDHVVTTTLEHNSVLRPLEALRVAGVATYTPVRVEPDGRLDLAAFAAAFTPRTRLVAVNHASNVTGAVLPLAAVVALAHERGVPVLVDASQTAGHLELDYDEIGADLIAFTGHKGLLGPPGTGGLYVRDPSAVRPLLRGGTGVASHSLAHPEAMPAKFEAGTLNYVGIAGLGAAAATLTGRVPALRMAELALLDACVRRLRSVDGVRLVELAPGVERVPILSLTVDGLYPSELSAVLDRDHGVMARAGLHCAPLAHQVLGTAPHGTLRISLGPASSAADVDVLVEALQAVAAGAAR